MGRLESRKKFKIWTRETPRRSRMSELSKEREKRVEFARSISSFATSFPSRGLPFFPALVCLLLGGCAVGPNFKKPAAPDISDYTAASLPTTAASANVAAGEPQHFLRGSDIP